MTGLSAQPQCVGVIPWYVFYVTPESVVQPSITPPSPPLNTCHLGTTEGDMLAKGWLGTVSLWAGIYTNLDSSVLYLLKGE